MPTRLSATVVCYVSRTRDGPVCTITSVDQRCACGRRRARASTGGLDLERAGGASSGIGDPGGQCLDVAGRTADDGGGADGRR